MHLTFITRCSTSTTAQAINPDMAVPTSSSAATSSCRSCRRFNFQGSHAINLPMRSVGCLLLVLARPRFFCFCDELSAGGYAGHASALTGDPSKQGSSELASVAMRPNPASHSTQHVGCYNCSIYPRKTAALLCSKRCAVADVITHPLASALAHQLQQVTA